MTWAAGIDVGGTQLKAVAVDAGGRVLARTVQPTEDGVATPVDWMARAQAALSEFAAQVGVGAAAVGVAAPGLAAPDGRSIAHLPGKLAGLVGLDWTTALGRTEIVPVLNDGHAALLGEAWIGAARGRRHVVMLTLGTGIGGAVLSDGRLLRGAIGRAGHIGHLCLDPDGEPSITGMPGAIEVLAGDCTVARRSGGRFADTAALVAAHRTGDALATSVWLKSIRALGCAIGSCINLFDPEIVVLGGGIAQAGEALFVPLARELDRVEWRPGGHRVPVVPAELGEWAGGIGAARRALRPEASGGVEN
jgi:glucokinase